MKNTFRTFASVAVLSLALASAPGNSWADTLEVLKAQPLSQAPGIKGADLKPVQSGSLKIPTITWGGDVPTVLADEEGLFKAEGLSATLFHEDDFAKQVRGVLAGETPFLRGTFDMINAAAEVFKKNGTELVVLDQLTWSRGGDALVVRPGADGKEIKSLSDLKGKKIALQLYGPHMYLLAHVLEQAGLKLSDVNIVWLKQLTLPTDATNGKIVDARSAFANDSSIDAAFVISPDAGFLTGKESPVPDAKVLFSTKTADHVIADVYAVRKDWYDKHKSDAFKFVHALMVAQEHFDVLVNDKVAQKKAYGQLLTDAATLLVGSPQGTGDVEGMIGDADFVGFGGNVAFFTGEGTTRNFNVMKDEIQEAFVGLKLLSGPVSLQNAGWDYAQLAKGLKNADLNVMPRVTFDAQKAQVQIEKEVAAETTSWDQEGSLFKFEVYFEPKASKFNPSQYVDAFRKVLKLSQTFGGAIITIEGNTDPTALNQAKASGQKPLVMAVEQSTKNLSMERAQAVRDAYVKFANDKGLKIDSSQLIAVGMGATHPNFAYPHDEGEWRKNMRVVFRVKQVEAEMDHFQPAPKH